MATRTVAPKTPKAAAKRLADLEIENKRLADLLAKREADDKDEDKDERDGDDDTEDKSKDKDSDDERDGDDDKKDEDEDSDDERDGDDSDEENDADEADEKDDKRSASGKRKSLTEAEVRKAAEAAVRADRKRGAAIREVAAQFGFPKLGERHANGETSVRAFKDLVLERLADRQKKRGNTTFAAAGTAEHDEASRSGHASPTAARDFDKGAAEARALLGKKA